MKKALILASAVLVALAFQYAIRAQGIDGETGIERSVKKMQAQLGKTNKDVGLPSGTVVIWLSGDTCPEGFSRVSALDGVFLKGSRLAGQRGGSANHAHRGTVDITHNHTFTGETNSPAYGSFIKEGDKSRYAADQRHTHRFSGRTNAMDYFNARKPFETEPASNEPPYMTVLFCQKD